MADSPDPNPVALSLPWGKDLRLTNNGSLVFVSGIEKLRERIIRRFFTGAAIRTADGTYWPAEYIFDQNYGFGASRLVGEPASDDIAAKLEAKIRASVLIDEGVDVTRDPVIKLFRAENGAIWANVMVYTLGAEVVYINFAAQENKAA